jgi:hypothetical protein
MVTVQEEYTRPKPRHWSNVLERGHDKVRYHFLHRMTLGMILVRENIDGPL